VRKDTFATRKRIIDTAEKLFADNGVEATSLLDITKAAEQKNRSALQYHFKNKDGMLHAVLDKHALGIAEQRTAMLDRLEAANDYSLYDLVGTLVQPLASQLDNKDGGREFLKIHSELMNSERYRNFRKEREDLNNVERIHAMSARFLESQDIEALQARGILVGCLLIHGLANYLPQQQLINRQVFLHTLTQAIVEILVQDAPPAPK
jgi:AcrR family transcriptional regulator